MFPVPPEGAWGATGAPSEGDPPGSRDVPVVPHTTPGEPRGLTGRLRKNGLLGGLLGGPEGFLGGLQGLLVSLLADIMRPKLLSMKNKNHEKLLRTPGGF